ncbi:MAG: DMT family transporter [Oscillospiraceae bacterium]|nr:DMT family transporter [Oscillospiraceae bacterium]
MKKHLPQIFILTAGITWGMIGLFSRSLYSAGFTPQNIVLIRNFGSLAVMTVLFAIVDKSTFRIKLRHFHYFIGTGIVSVVMFSLLYFMCQQQSSLATAAILLYTSPAIVMLLSAVIWHDKITKNKLAALVVTFMGCVFVSGILSGSLAVSAVSLATGLGSAFFYALYSIFGRFALEKYSSYTVTYYTFLCAAAASLFVVSPAETFSLVFSSASVTLLVFGLIAVSTVIPFILYTKGLSQTESGKAAILASVEPVAASLTGIIAFGEPLTFAVVAGLVCILIAIYILN